MPVEVCCPGELGRTMRTEFGLGQNWYVALMTTHLGRSAVLLSKLKGNFGSSNTVHGGNGED